MREEEEGGREGERNQYKGESVRMEVGRIGKKVEGREGGIIAEGRGSRMVGRE